MTQFDINEQNHEAARTVTEQQRAAAQGTEWAPIETGTFRDTRSLFSRLSDVDAPDTPPVDADELPELWEAYEAAHSAYLAYDDVITEVEAHKALTNDPGELAEQEYQQALRAGDKKAEYRESYWRQKRAEVVVDAEKKLAEYRKANSAYKATLKRHRGDIVTVTARAVDNTYDALANAEAEYMTAWRTYANATRAHETALFEGDFFTVSNARQMYGHAAALTTPPNLPTKANEQHRLYTMRMNGITDNRAGLTDDSVTEH